MFSTRHLYQRLFILCSIFDWIQCAATAATSTAEKHPSVCVCVHHWWNVSIILLNFWPHSVGTQNEIFVDARGMWTSSVNAVYLVSYRNIDLPFERNVTTFSQCALFFSSCFRCHSLTPISFDFSFYLTISPSRSLTPSQCRSRFCRRFKFYICIPPPLRSPDRCLWRLTFARQILSNVKVAAQNCKNIAEQKVFLRLLWSARERTLHCEQKLFVRDFMRPKR